MPHITTCSKCNKIYEESSEESANDSVRKCNDCFNERGVKPMIDAKKIEACEKHEWAEEHYTKYRCIYCSFSHNDNLPSAIDEIARKPRELDLKKIVSTLEKRHNEPYTQSTGFPTKFMHYARAFRDAYTAGLLWEEKGK